MTTQAIVAWAAKRRWPGHIALDHDMSLPPERRPIPWAECQGSNDPVCGQARFSVHGCNGGGPSRAQYIAATE